MGGELGKYCGNILASDSEDNTLDGINRLDINRVERIKLHPKDQQIVYLSEAYTLSTGKYFMNAN